MSIALDERNVEDPLKGDEDDKLERSREETDMGCLGKLQKSVVKSILPKTFHSEYNERANCLPPPIFIILISIAELAVFIYYAAWKPKKHWVTLDESLLLSPLTYKPESRHEAWRFVSYMFMHSGLEHIMCNLAFQLLLGIPLEMVHKGIDVGIVYLAGVIAGSLASSIFDPFSALVGASGGVYALIGGYFMNAVVNFRQMLKELSVIRIAAVVLFISADFGFAIYRRFSASEERYNVSFVAHLGGLVAGMSVGYIVFSHYKKGIKERFNDHCFWICIVGFILFIVFAALFNVFISPAP